MKFRHLLVPAVAAGALAVGANASAALMWQWTGSVTNWQNALQGPGDAIPGDITDGPPPPNTGTVNGPLGVNSGDGDTTFTINTNTFDPATTVTLSEHETSSLDYYNVGLDFSTTAAGDTGPGMLGYTVDTTDPGGLSGTQLGVIPAFGSAANVTKEFFTSYAAYQANDAPFLTLTSLNGSTESGAFASRQSFFVLDTVNSGTVEDIHNHFVPDPGTLSLLGIGMVGLGARRRMTKKAKA